MPAYEGRDQRLLSALKGENRGRPPFWMMRQAGRYLPEYRTLRDSYHLRDLFFTPELAVAVTRMPLVRFGFDAAILFSDIAVIALALGLALDFCEGPIVTPQVTPEHLSRLTLDYEPLEPVMQAIRFLKADLTVPLLGFCGAPFTVASYLIGDLDKTLAWMRQDAASFSHLLEAIAGATFGYVHRQIEAGIDAIQIFDSWAGLLTPEEFRRFSLPYVRRFVDAASVPALFFMRGASRYIEEIPCALSLDTSIAMADARLRTSRPLQGNVDPELLFEPLPMIKREVAALLESMQGDPAFILNLGHGIKPHTPLTAVECLRECSLKMGS